VCFEQELAVNSDYDFRIMRVLRRRLNLTLHGLAERSGLTYPTVESVETNKTLASLKRRKAEVEQRSYLKSDKGMENCRVARYDKGKLIRVTAEKGDHVHVMGLHEDVHEFCYVLSGWVELRIEDETYRLGRDDTILFDGLLDHSYTQIETGEYVTVHIPKDIRILERLLEGKAEGPPEA
jgi:transcriptional regulator with XRE-family HTH domain